MILITGATGTIGSNLTYILSHTGVPLRIMVRDIEKLNPTFKELNIDIVEGDFNEPETIEKCLVGVEKAFLSSPGDQNLALFQNNFIEVAVEANINSIVKLSIIGAAPDALFTIGKAHFQIEQKIERSGIDFTHLRPHSLMQNFFQYASFIRKEGAFLAPMGEGKIPMVDARDVSMVAAATLTTKGHEGSIYELTGPEAISYFDAAEIFTKVLGKTIKFIDVPLDNTRDMLKNGGWPDWMIEDMLSLYKFFKEGRASKMTDTVEKLLDRKAMTFENFVRDYANLFREQTEEK